MLASMLSVSSDSAAHTVYGYDAIAASPSKENGLMSACCSLWEVERLMASISSGDCVSDFAIKGIMLVSVARRCRKMMSSSLRSVAMISRYWIKQHRRHALSYHVEYHIDLETTASREQAYDIALASSNVCKWLAELRLNILQDRLHALHPRNPVTVTRSINKAKISLKHSVAHTLSTA